VQFLPDQAPRYRKLVAAQWMGRSVNVLLPVAQLGGDVVRVRLLSMWGTDGVTAMASVVVDKTVQATASMLWGLVGISLLVGLSLDDGLAASALGGLFVMGLGVSGFVLVQRAGMSRFVAVLAKSLGKNGLRKKLVERAKDLDAEIRGIYRRKGRLATACLVRALGLAIQTGEVWLAAYLLGHPIGAIEALTLKSMNSLLNDVAFFVPNSYGVQEGSYVLLGGLIGLDPGFMLALSLSTRIRDVAIDVPGFLFWQHCEGRRFVRVRRRNKAALTSVKTRHEQSLDL
jgi:putative membrane protein